MSVLDNHIPKLSPKVSISNLTANEYIISNTNDGHYVKINKNLFNLVSLIDGNRTLKDIADLYSQTSGKKITPEMVNKLFEKELYQYGIFDGFDHLIKKYEKPSYLKLSFIIFKEKHLNKITHFFYPFFRARNAVLILLLAVAFIAANFVLKRDTFLNFNVSDVFYIYIALMIVGVIFHELGHASAAIFFGARTRGIGVGFYLFRPVFFADLTDVWKLNKQRRIVVTLSGVYFQIVFAFVLLLINLILQNAALLSVALLVFLHHYSI